MMKAPDYLQSVRRQFEFYKRLGEKAMAQMPEASFYARQNSEANSVCILVHHLSGNMLSRWTGFLHDDGEKPWRKRDAEFDPEPCTRYEMTDRWERGWQCLFQALDSLTEADLERCIRIRNQPHTVLEAINRQLAHYAYHVGQIVYVAKLSCGANWTSLSIPKGESDSHNRAMFGGSDSAK